MRRTESTKTILSNNVRTFSGNLKKKMETDSMKGTSSAWEYLLEIFITRKNLSTGTKITLLREVVVSAPNLIPLDYYFYFMVNIIRNMKKSDTLDGITLWNDHVGQLDKDVSRFDTHTLRNVNLNKNFPERSDIFYSMYDCQDIQPHQKTQMRKFIETALQSKHIPDDFKLRLVELSLSSYEAPKHSDTTRIIKKYLNEFFQEVVNSNGEYFKNKKEVDIYDRYLASHEDVYQLIGNGNSYFQQFRREVLQQCLTESKLVVENKIVKNKEKVIANFKAAGDILYKSPGLRIYAKKIYEENLNGWNQGREKINGKIKSIKKEINILDRKKGNNHISILERKAQKQQSLELLTNLEKAPGYFKMKCDLSFLADAINRNDAQKFDEIISNQPIEFFEESVNDNKDTAIELAARLSRFGFVKSLLPSSNQGPIEYTLKIISRNITKKEINGGKISKEEGETKSLLEKAIVAFELKKAANEENRRNNNYYDVIFRISENKSSKNKSTDGDKRPNLNYPLLMAVKENKNSILRTLNRLDKKVRQLQKAGATLINTEEVKNEILSKMKEEFSQKNSVNSLDRLVDQKILELQVNHLIDLLSKKTKNKKKEKRLNDLKANNTMTADEKNTMTADEKLGKVVSIAMEHHGIRLRQRTTTGRYLREILNTDNRKYLGAKTEDGLDYVRRFFIAGGYTSLEKNQKSRISYKKLREFKAEMDIHRNLEEKEREKVPDYIQLTKEKINEYENNYLGIDRNKSKEKNEGKLIDFGEKLCVEIASIIKNKSENKEIFPSEIILLNSDKENPIKVLLDKFSEFLETMINMDLVSECWHGYQTRQSPEELKELAEKIAKSLCYNIPDLIHNNIKEILDKKNGLKQEFDEFNKSVEKTAVQLRTKAAEMYAKKEVSDDPSAKIGKKVVQKVLEKLSTENNEPILFDDSYCFIKDGNVSCYLDHFADFIEEKINKEKFANADIFSRDQSRDQDSLSDKLSQGIFMKIKSEFSGKMPSFMKLEIIIEAQIEAQILKNRLWEEYRLKAPDNIIELLKAYGVCDIATGVHTSISEEIDDYEKMNKMNEENFIAILLRQFGVKNSDDNKNTKVFKLLNPSPTGPQYNTSRYLPPEGLELFKKYLKVSGIQGQHGTECQFKEVDWEKKIKGINGLYQDYKNTEEYLLRVTSSYNKCCDKIHEKLATQNDIRVMTSQCGKKINAKTSLKKADEPRRDQELAQRFVGYHNRIPENKEKQITYEEALQLVCKRRIDQSAPKNQSKKKTITKNNTNSNSTSVTKNRYGSFNLTGNTNENEKQDSSKKSKKNEKKTMVIAV